jgi:hypothetical protein
MPSKSSSDLSFRQILLQISASRSLLASIGVLNPIDTCAYSKSPKLRKVWRFTTKAGNVVRLVLTGTPAFEYQCALTPSEFAALKLILLSASAVDPYSARRRAKK